LNCHFDETIFSLLGGEKVPLLEECACYYMECIIIVSSWSTYKSKWTWSSKDYSAI